MKQRDVVKGRWHADTILLLSGDPLVPWQHNTNITSQPRLHEILISPPSGCGGSWKDRPAKRAVPRHLHFGHKV